jgi:MFS transporter, PPP family, 3-phenylpropionic acid transporter
MSVHAVSARHLALLYFVHFTGFGVFVPFVPVWYEARGFDARSLGLLLATPPLVGIVAPFVVGVVADATGLRARLMSAAAIVAALAALGMAGALLLPDALQLPALITAVAIFAVARTPLFGLTDVIALESLGGERARYGRLRLFGSLGFLCAVVLFPMLTSARLHHVLPCAVAAAYAATFFVSRTLPSATTKLGFDLPGALRMIRENAAFFAALLLWQLGYAAYDSTFTRHLDALGVARQASGFIWGVGVVAEVALMAAAPAILRRFSSRTLLLLALAASVLRWTGTALADTIAEVLALQLLHAVSFGLLWTVANSELHGIAGGADQPAIRLATAQGAMTTSVALGSALGMFTWPTVYAERGAAFVFGGGAAAAALAFGIVALSRR